ncbi:RING finger protein 37 [Callorhinchus milii]|uniref:RING finger protein 37 n=1 Tax=Callorhinchus milii TaxID=7868 RepID=UPI001C3FBB5E|nr:RING finger protein 37 [Callorhinchus milii]XP_042199518.1 RING finger protein 37 [Callorhinchus milii]
MTLNLCLPHFRPRIHCNKVCADGYEVSNLISADPQQRARGFRSEYFIKPPLDITVSFPFSSDICRVEVDVSAGSQSSIALSIFTCSSCGWSDVKGNKDGSSHPPVPAFSDKDTFTLVGKVVLKNHRRVLFRHRAFKPRAPFTKVQPVVADDSVLIQDLWSKGPWSLGGVRHFRICIAFVSGGHLPCLKRLSVWGQPARSCPLVVIESLFQVHRRLCQETADRAESVFGAEDTCSTATGNGLGPSTSAAPAVTEDIPEEFLDPITSDIMALPVLLPCGKAVDQSTLEKYLRGEATWGRGPNDPFTGVPFSRHSKPAPHPVLKARLDSFLLRTAVPGRTVVGRTRAGIIPSSSVKREREPVDAAAMVPSSTPQTISLSAGGDSDTACAAKRFKAEVKHLPGVGEEPGAISHEQRLSQSLDSALASALSTFPSFTDRQRPPIAGSSNTGCAAELDSSSSDDVCIACCRAFSAYCSYLVIYRLPCGHLICRPCLSERQKTAALSCLKCNQPVNTSDVTRVHL